jgi:hypothetical protein
MFWKVLLCGSSWTASSQIRRGNATSFGGLTTPQPWLMSRKRGGGTCSPQVLEIAEKILIKAHQMSVRILPVFIPTGENILADAASRFQRDSRLAVSSLSVQGDLGKVGSPHNRPLCQQRLQTDSTLHQLGRVRLPRSRRRTLPEVGLHPRVCFSSDSSPQESSEETRDVEGHLHPGLSPLGSPDVASFASDAEGVGGLPTSVHGEPSDGPVDRKAAPNPSQPSSCRLEDFWRLHSLQNLPSDTRDLHEAGWRPSTESRYKITWQSFKRHLCFSSVSLDRVGVTDVMNYLTLLHNSKLSYSTINLQRSALYMTLANVDKAPVGSHPLVTRLVPSVWDPVPVMDLFMHWSLPLSRAQLVRKCFFILAITSARQLSELFSLQCSGQHIQINDDSLFSLCWCPILRQILSATSVSPFVSELGRKTHPSAQWLSPAPSWKKELCWTFVMIASSSISIVRTSLCLKSFRGCISRCLLDAGIEAPPGSLRATVASSGLGRGVCMADILLMGDWSSSSTFLRFYASL